MAAETFPGQELALAPGARWEESWELYSRSCHFPEGLRG